MRKKLVVGNWKMNGGLKRNAALLAGLAACGNREGVDVVVCPPYPYLAQAVAAVKGAGVAVGGQDLCAFKDGAYTGEVSASMLLDLGCAWVIVGHSERRSLFGEADAVVAAKVQAALDAGLSPILCVGESLAQREAGEAEAVVCSQLDHVVDVLGAERFAGVVVAYEPVWAIGTGKTASPEQAQGMHREIRMHLERRGVAAEGVKILYGGSVTAANASQLFAEPDIDGALVGGASLVADSFSSICAAAAAR
ncbi:triose-phosphate isomerase [Zoogloea oryzae]|uniref:triose-phosphate isomerase n=1 Tax=Zoogloea oryzae TaxID=310767 RepID=UPI0024E13D93|nr:triose-phosphate isomerase [Zoogloea oryzae]